MTVHRDEFLVNKPTDELISNFICITTLHVSGSLSAHHQVFLAVHQYWYILCKFDGRFATRSRTELLLVAKGHQICIKYRCTAKKS